MAVQHLPPSEQEYLVTLRDDLPALRARVRALRAQGWTLASIGAPLEARRSTVRSWERHPAPSQDSQLSASPPLPSPPLLRPTPSHASSRSPHVRALRPDVPIPDQLQISSLAPLARKVRGGTPPNSPYREAKAELNTLLAKYYARGVPVQRLADITGVSYRAMKVRLDQVARSHAHSHPRASGL